MASCLITYLATTIVISLRAVTKLTWYGSNFPIDKHTTLPCYHILFPPLLSIYLSLIGRRQTTALCVSDSFRCISFMLQTMVPQIRRCYRRLRRCVSLPCSQCYVRSWYALITCSAWCTALWTASSWVSRERWWCLKASKRRTRLCWNKGYLITGR